MQRIGWLATWNRAPRMRSWAGLLLAMVLATTTAQAQEWLYTVRPGDNIWNIATDYLANMNHWPKLQALNGIADPERLPPGTKLRIPIAWLKTRPTVARIVSVHGKVEAT